MGRIYVLIMVTYADKMIFELLWNFTLLLVYTFFNCSVCSGVIMGVFYFSTIELSSVSMPVAFIGQVHICYIRKRWSFGYTEQSIDVNTASVIGPFVSFRHAYMFALGDVDISIIDLSSYHGNDMSNVTLMRYLDLKMLSMVYFLLPFCFVSPRLRSCSCSMVTYGFLLVLATFLKIWSAVFFLSWERCHRKLSGITLVEKECTSNIKPFIADQVLRMYSIVYTYAQDLAKCQEKLGSGWGIDLHLDPNYSQFVHGSAMSELWSMCLVTVYMDIFPGKNHVSELITVLKRKIS